MINPFFLDPFRASGEIDRWFGDFSPGRFGVSTDIVDEKEAVRVSMELPGMSKDDVDITIDNGALVVRGEKRNHDEHSEDGVFRSERFYGHVHRTIPVPKDVDVDKASASFKDGVLNVRFPKLESPKDEPRRISVS